MHIKDIQKDISKLPDINIYIIEIKYIIKSCKLRTKSEEAK